MTPQDRPGPLNPKLEECLRLEKCWAWFLCLGILLVVVGIMASKGAGVTGEASSCGFKAPITRSDVLSWMCSECALARAAAA